MKKRSRVSIVYDILSYIESEGGEAQATRIATATGLAYDRLVKILEDLNERGIVEMSTVERSRRVRLTERGHILLKRLRELRELIRDLGIEID